MTKHIPLCFNYPSTTDNLIQYAHTKAFPVTIVEWTIGDLNTGYFQLFQINSDGHVGKKISALYLEISCCKMKFDYFAFQRKDKVFRSRRPFKVC